MANSISSHAITVDLDLNAYPCFLLQHCLSRALLSGRWLDLCFYDGMDAGGTATTECPPKRGSEWKHEGAPTTASTMRMSGPSRIHSTSKPVGTLCLARLQAARRWIIHGRFLQHCCFVLEEPTMESIGRCYRSGKAYSEMRRRPQL
jgi:hypothetical protein